MTRPPEAPVQEVSARAYTIPTDRPESDGTLAWDSTTLVMCRVRAGGETGIGWTYGHAAIAQVINTDLAETVRGRDPFDVPAAWTAMVGTLRNNGRPGLSSMAVAALDIALWDLKARLLALPLCQLLGSVHETVPIYGSGGFTSYTEAELAAQLSAWAEDRIGMVKIKVGRHPEQDPARLRTARAAIGPDTELFVDANGAFRPTEALAAAHMYAEHGVRWFEEPVSSDDLDGLRMVRARAPAGMSVAAGEYGYDVGYFERMVSSGAVDVLQADVTRCAGITELRRVDALCQARNMSLSLHCAPTLHANIGPALSTLLHLEYFHDHVRIEEMLFDGVPRPADGALRSNHVRPGHGVELRQAEAERFAV
jgi:L-alanine-DL-glutamate epimerase-like enolase superfamily enzyme